MVQYYFTLPYGRELLAYSKTMRILGAEKKSHPSEFRIFARCQLLRKFSTLNKFNSYQNTLESSLTTLMHMFVISRC